MTPELELIKPSMRTHANFWQNPYSFYEKLRAIAPVYKGTILKQSGWYVTGHDEATIILSDSKFQNRIPLPITSTKYEVLKNIQHHMLLFQNQTDHRRIRTLVSQAFTLKQVESLRPSIRAIADELLDQLEKKQQVDIVSEFSFPLATLVIAKILGVPKEDRYQFKEWTASLIETIDFTRSRKTLINGGATVMKLMTYFRSLIEKRKNEPKDDLISTFVQGDSLTEEELLATCILLIIAGHETTVNLISNGLYSLLNHPSQLTALIKNPALIESAVEECLRFESPTQLTARIVSEDYQLNGNTMKKGEQVYILLGAVNRDPKTFTKPHLFDMTRKPNPHLAFGYGSHFCLGSSLARIEAQVALLTLIERLPELRLVQTDISYRKLFGFRSLVKLPVTFTREGLG
ncbi:cytochrome P450 [Bacillus changyiensis]|uniref:cytochrome P450 n=1 Tax=Bacillus changyiensis TaxID=3004103 RepID=UPI0022E67D9B|nr:cytochrome P450 [Bacillus changyiensis]MDA1477169.1 cytochrome P450 [Bacillus changyiensis]